MARRRLEQTPEPLVIDRAAAAEKPSTTEIRLWAADQRAFISSVMDELRSERRAVADAIRDIGVEPIWFEEFGGRDADAQDAYISEVGTSTIFVCILGARYGRPLPTRYSATHTEYNFAEEHGLRMSVYSLPVSGREGPQQAFLDTVRQFHTAPSVAPADLPSTVTRRICGIAAEDLSPWCKLGSLIFRASKVVQSGDRITVTTKVRSPEVAHRLDELTNDRWNRQEVQFTWCTHSQLVVVGKTEMTTTASVSRTYQLSLERKDRTRDTFLNMSFNGRSADDLTEIAIRTALLGEANPLGTAPSHFVTEMPDPFEPLRGAHVADEILRPIARLMLTEALVGGGGVARITNFRLGSAIVGKRRIDLGWETPKRYSNERSEMRRIDGRVELA
jgi:hypothetical protein